MDTTNFGMNVNKLKEWANKVDIAGILQPLLQQLNALPPDIQTLLDTVADALLEPKLTLHVASAFRAIILDLLVRCSRRCVKVPEFDWRRHLRFTFALSRILPHLPRIMPLVIKYLESNPPFYQLPTKNTELNDDDVCMMAKTTYRFLKYSRQNFAYFYDWSPLLHYLDHSSLEVRWYVGQSFAIITKMGNQIKKQFSCSLVPLQVHDRLVSSNYTCDSFDGEFSVMDIRVDDGKEGSLGGEESIIPVKSADLVNVLVDVCGVILPMCKEKRNTDFMRGNSVVLVDTTCQALQAMALSVSSGSSVLLEGYIGTGKTMLVNYLAAISGRHGPPDFIKVQMNDQMDSKSLLGTYCCTNVPGKFVWRSGTLTQAVKEGSWILLEDVDCAPMDVISILLPLLESGRLTILEQNTVVKVHPDFRMFATYRLASVDIDDHGQKLPHNISLLCSYLTRIRLTNLSMEELLKVCRVKFPNITTILKRLLGVYDMLRTAKIIPCGNQFYGTARVLSTRDFMKCCKRIDSDVRNRSLSDIDALEILQEINDVFCTAIPMPADRSMMLHKIGAKFGILKDKIDYFDCRHKPSIKRNSESLVIGATVLTKHRNERHLFTWKNQSVKKFSFTRLSCILLERIAKCIRMQEPVLLVGETGTGKTSTLEFIAREMGCKLVIVNMSQQSDTADLLGGYKPTNMRYLVGPVREKFEALFCRTYSRSQNVQFLGHIQQSFGRQDWNTTVRLLEHAIVSATKKLGNIAKKNLLLKNWEELKIELHDLKKQIRSEENALVFSFKEGTLVQALQNGDWLLLDEINLATSETLECLSSILESRHGSIVLTEKGDMEPIVRKEGFHLFACMNPANDIGKKDMPNGIRNRFTEIFVDEISSESDLKLLIMDYLEGLGLSTSQVEHIVKFYLEVRRLADISLSDGTGHRPNFTLRTLCRALSLASTNPCGSSSRSLYECFCLSFLTQLNTVSHHVMESLIQQFIFNKHFDTRNNCTLKLPLLQPRTYNSIQIEGYWIRIGEKDSFIDKKYIMTPTVKQHLRDIARIVSYSHFPVLLQGETSVGKTSLVNWLAEATGNYCVRINNHEHTDLQEYIGCYTADGKGKLVFKEGVLAIAMRKGYWVILDELNLAPSDVLEALNRVLDDNRELFIAETQQIIRAHERFRIFATQNPAGYYGGRKQLSRAFRNRFIELHFHEIPHKELVTILCERCKLPKSYGSKIVDVMRSLQTLRCESNIFAGKRGFITLRDLFRWAERYHRIEIGDKYKFHDWEQYLADEGYMLLAGRVRSKIEEQVIIDVLRKHLKRTVEPNLLYGSDNTSFTAPENWSLSTRSTLQVISMVWKGKEAPHHLVLTHNFRRLSVLVSRALQFGEPVLLVGETGCGKTTACQLFANLNQQDLFTINCHMHTDTADFIGSLRPIRQAEMGEEVDGNNEALFKWCDGPLVTAMQTGAMFLIDEISLADDSVLERLNSVLESDKRCLVLAEKGSSSNIIHEDVEQVVAHTDFRVIATMNPGGDYGKKELTPALRNRFTEIWCPITSDRSDMMMIIEQNLLPDIRIENPTDVTSGIGNCMLQFIDWFSKSEFSNNFVFSIRDLLSWIQVINVCTVDHGMNVCLAYIHGACLVFIDGLGIGPGSSLINNTGSAFCARRNCLMFVLNQLVNLGLDEDVSDQVHKLCNGELGKILIRTNSHTFSIESFSIKKGNYVVSEQFDYAMEAPTTAFNVLRLMRGLQLDKPILLEGTPGVGKTSLVAALAKATQNKLVRINLSEQTDITDLFGCDLPVEGGSRGEFGWRDGPFLAAVKAGYWIVLDELNLASQAVLEGLNACLDHRNEVFIPELGLTFNIQQSTRIFACQNPLNQGGGRKGLPKSFVNRFTQVYVDSLTEYDYLFICKSIYPAFDISLLRKMISFNSEIYHETMIDRKWGTSGSPWEFNLRDLFRWCDLIMHHHTVTGWDPGRFVELIYSSRMRTDHDATKVFELYRKVFNSLDVESDMNFMPYASSRLFRLSSDFVQFGYACLPRRSISEIACTRDTYILHNILKSLEAAATCIEMNWMPIIIGKSGCGKSHLIRILAELTGNTLRVLPVSSSMDTTELLGGFEQSSATRPLQDLLEALDNVIFSVASSLSYDSCQDAWYPYFTKLLCKWLSLKYFCEKNMKFDNSFREIVDILEKLIAEDIKETYESFNSSFDLQELQQKMEKIKSVHSSISLKPGGQFEWIESVVIDAMKKGHWLLIDNASFCNASVLDRLNPLLEPNGSLSVTERGLINGYLEDIQPHPNFRMIMCMDPSLGELSRAMRNRGIEIFVSGEFDTYDIATLWRAAGLTNSNRSNPVMQQFTSYNYADCNFAAKYISHGWTNKKSIHISNSLEHTTEVLVEDDDASATATESITYTGENRSNTAISEAFLVSLLPSVTELCSDGTYGNVVWDGCLLKAYLLMANELASCNYIKHATRIFVEKTSLTDWTLRSQWLHNLQDNVDSIAKYHISRAQKLLTEVFEDTIIELLYEKRPAFIPLFMSYADLPINAFLHASATKEEKTMRLDLCQLHAVNGLRVILFWKETLLEEICDFECCCKIHRASNSVLSLSRSAYEGKLSMLDLPHQSVVHLEPLFRVLDNVISNIIAVSDFTMSEEVTQELLDCIRWRHRFYRMCRSPADRFSFARLSLMWHWFKKRCLRKLEIYINNNSATPNVTALNAVVEKLDSDLGYSIKKLCNRSLMQVINGAITFKNDQLANVYERAITLGNILDVNLRNGPSESIKLNRLLTIQLHLRLGYDHRKELVDVIASIISRNCNVDNDINIELFNPASTLDKLEVLLHKDDIANQLYNLARSSTIEKQTSDTDNGLCHLSCTIAYLWPLFEQNLAFHRQHILNTLIKAHYDKNREQIDWSTIARVLQKHIDFSLNYTTQAPKFLSPLQYIINEAQDDVTMHSKLTITIPHIVLDSMSYYWRSVCSNNSTNWKDFFCLDRADTDQEMEGPREFFRGSIITTCMLELISEAASIRNNYYNIACIGQLEEKVNQLKVLSSYLWCNSIQIVNINDSIWKSVCTTLCLIISRVLVALRAFVAIPVSELDALSNTFYDDSLSKLDSNGYKYFKTVKVIIDEMDFGSDLHTYYQKVCKEMLILLSAVIEDFYLALENHFADKTRDDFTDFKMFYLGAAWLKLGLLLSIFACPADPVDPVVKRQIKLQFLKDEFLETESELKVRQEAHRLWTGHNWPLDDAECHDIYVGKSSRESNLMNNYTNLKTSITDLEKKIAYRPSPSLYENLITDIHNAQRTVAAVDHNLKLLQDLDPTGLNNISHYGKRAESALAKEFAWQKSMTAFTDNLNKNYSSYVDIYLPYAVCLSFMQFGMRLSASPLAKLHNVYKFTGCDITNDNSDCTKMNASYDKVIKSIAEFPTDSGTIAYLTQSHVQSILVRLNLLKSPNQHWLNVQFLNMLLLWAYTTILENSGLTVDFNFENLSSVFESYFSIWQQVQARHKLKEEQDLRAFRYRVKEHLTENESIEEERDVKNLFPNYSDEFESAVENMMNEDSSLSIADLEGDETDELVRLHSAIFTFLLSIDKSSRRRAILHVSEVSSNVFKRRYAIAGALIRLINCSICCNVDEILLRSHILMNKLLLDELAEADNRAPVKEINPMFYSCENSYDFYQDANVREAKRLPYVLKSFEARLHQLLIEWPDHPVLMELKLSVQRVLSFSIHSPLMKFLTGLEFILKKAQDWESYASKSVSIQDHLNNITRTITDWRTIELKSWSNLLDTVDRKFKKDVNRWWFYIYDICAHPYSNNGNQVIDYSETVNTLSQFMETCNLGEFCARLQLLRSFCKQLQYELCFPKFTSKHQLHEIFCNTYTYYSQFTNIVNERIHSLRSPIEKELRDFVKIMQWNDLNYWSLKEGITRCHHTLHKYMKKFRICISEPVVSLLTYKSELLHIYENHDEIHHSYVEKFAIHGLRSDAIAAQGRTNEIEETSDGQSQFLRGILEEFVVDKQATYLLPRIPALTHKFVRIIDHMIAGDKHWNLIVKLDKFSVKVIKLVKELQDDTKAIDIKNTANVKLLGARKRRSLAMLFSKLNLIGLSYRKGVRYANRHSFRKDMLSCKYIDDSLIQMCISLLTSDEAVASAWNDYPKYFYKSCAHYFALMSSLDSPSQDLTGSDVEKCKGFAAEFLRILFYQKGNVSVVANDIIRLRIIVDQLNSISLSTNENLPKYSNLPPQSKSVRWLYHIRALCSKCIRNLLELHQLLECCPNEHSNPLPTPLLPDYLSPLNKATASDPEVSKLIEGITVIRNDLIVMLTDTFENGMTAVSENQQSLVTWIQLDNIATICHKLECVAKIIYAVEDKLKCDTLAEVQSSKVIEPFKQLRLEILCTCNDYFAWQVNMLATTMNVDKEPFKEYLEQVNVTISRMLVVSQTLQDVKRYPSMAKKEVDDIEPPKEIFEDLEELDCELITLLQDRLENHLHKLRINKIIESFKASLEMLQQMHDKYAGDSYQLLLKSCCQLLSSTRTLCLHYTKIVKFYFNEYLLFHRTSSKLSYVLMNVFVELISKGFCQPDVSDVETEAEGATEFINQESCGVGEGAGAKDVSDMITGEEQLLDAQQENGLQEHDEEQNEIKVEDNAIEMSEDFDGQLQDAARQPNESDTDEKEPEVDENTFDKQMGEVDGSDEEVLDERLWGGESESEGEEFKDSKKHGKTNVNDETDIVAKDGSDIQQENRSDEQHGSNEADDISHTSEDHILSPQSPCVVENEDGGDNNNMEEGIETEDKFEFGSQELEIPEDLSLNHHTSSDDGDDDDKVEDQVNEEDKTNTIDAEEYMSSEDSKDGDDLLDPDNMLSNPQEDLIDEKPSDSNIRTARAGPNDEQYPTVDDYCNTSKTIDKNTEPLGNPKDLGEGMTSGPEDASCAGFSSYAESFPEAEVDQRSSKEFRHTGQRRKLAEDSEMPVKRRRAIDSSTTDTQPMEVEDIASSLYQHLTPEQESLSKETVLDARNPDEEVGNQAIKDEEFFTEEAIESEETLMNAMETEIPEVKSKHKTNVKSEKSSASEIDNHNLSEHEEVHTALADETAIEKKSQESYHMTSIDSLYQAAHVSSRIEIDEIEKIRQQLELQLSELSSESGGEIKAQEMWRYYSRLTSSLSQELCEQLRLVLEPTLVNKLKGDYRTGKRLNIRKIIPYIASNYRKDKIWLRRTKKSKRQYQIVLAIDDSSSMSDNHSKQLAFESLSVISNALVWLEAGELAVMTFGEEVKLLHSFYRPFNDEVGGNILNQFSFNQKKTRISELVNSSTAMLISRRSTVNFSKFSTSQLLIIISDGRGLFAEGTETLLKSIRSAMEAGIFIVFIILDNPKTKDSIIDIRIPVFDSSGKIESFKSYMDNFPFPYYMLLRNINSLPQVLASALRQWFELINSNN